jgi:hypothetical protein
MSRHSSSKLTCSKLPFERSKNAVKWVTGFYALKMDGNDLKRSRAFGTGDGLGNE